MFKHIRPVWAEINLDNLSHNMREIKKITRAKDVIAVVKADGYGHGAIDTSNILLQNGATALAVAVISEAIELRRSGIKCPIMILGYTPSIYGESLIKYDISPTVFTYEYAKEISDIAKTENKIIKIQIALDTGMGRIGFMPDKNSVEEVYKISKLPNIMIEGIFSHFATSDEANKKFTLEQIKKYEDFIHNLKERGINIKIRHIANSAAIIDLEDTHFEAVRSGIIMYGYYPSKEVNVSKLLLKPVMTLKTNIIHIKKVPKDYSISYGRTYKTQEEEIIATLPVGYADGYTRQLSDKALVIINGKLAPVVGRICMDQCMVNVTDIEEVKVGDEVILMGQSDNVKMDADDIAGLLETINYEVVCMIGKRVPRVYIQDNKVIKIRNYV